MAAVASLVACVPAAEAPNPLAPPRLQVVITRSVEPPPGAPDRCFARDGVPVEDALFPDPRGIPALWFEIPCGAVTDASLIAALQRALTARGFLASTGTGALDPDTRAAIAAYQTPLRLRSEVLSIAAARELGLAIWIPPGARDR